MPSVLTLFLEWIPSSRTWTIFRNWLINPFKSLCIWFKRFVFHCSFLLIFLLFNITIFLFFITDLHHWRHSQWHRKMLRIDPRALTHTHVSRLYHQANQRANSCRFITKSGAPRPFGDPSSRPVDRRDHYSYRKHRPHFPTASRQPYFSSSTPATTLYALHLREVEWQFAKSSERGRRNGSGLCYESGG